MTCSKTEFPFYLVRFASKILEGYLNTTFGIPKSVITASNLSNFLKETMGVPQELEVLQGRVTKAVA